MTTEELEEKLEAGTETQTTEFKCACDWNVNSLAKDILALSNVRDGGYIIIGVEDGSFVRQGVTTSQKESYKIDIMRDQMTAYADPHVDFSVSFPKDSGGKEYIAIKVFPFRDIPVICRKNNGDVKIGVLYYRNRNRRTESAAVSNSYDMRDIIQLATVKMMQGMTELGLTVDNSTKQKLDKELGGL